eukprot:TRINITY_DN3702_c1_g1_i1.p1 TRINITY_DN3702_c1_g1~~TRINITY_DN3702_c1_g1_i1.p1  ORF type:complete len:587 (+),score=186.97 TRINITY_DN3702_c1_g1_i1:75-1763(+)
MMRRRGVTQLLSLCALAAAADGRSCGQPAPPPGDCTSQGWQCRRWVTVPGAGPEGYCVRGLDGEDGPCYADEDCYSGVCGGGPYNRSTPGGNCSTAGCGSIPSAGCARGGPAGGKTAGYVCAAIAVVFFGSNFIPVKTHEAGNGIFFQWIVCCGIMFSGICVQLARRSTFHALAMLGGVLWCTGNLLTVLIIKSLGLGLALCIWGAFNTLAGWGSGKFGWLGVRKEEIADPVVNGIGLALAILAVFVFARVDPTLDDRPRVYSSSCQEYHDNDVEREPDSPGSQEAAAPLVRAQPTRLQDSSGGEKDSGGRTPTATAMKEVLADVRFGFGGFGTTTAVPAATPSASPASPTGGEAGPAGSAPEPKRVTLILRNAADVLAGNDDLFLQMLGRWRKPVGITCAAASGVLQGLSFDPAQHLADNAGKYSRENNDLYSADAVDYAFAHFSGIFFTSTCVMILYAVLKHTLPRYNRPVAYASIVLPGLLSGVIWAIGAICWFIANTRLGLATAFPIITTGPGIVSAFWGVFVFKEIGGRRNLLRLLVALVLLGTAVALITASSQNSD